MYDRPTQLQRRESRLLAPAGHVGGVRKADVSFQAISVTFWLSVALALLAIGYAIGTLLDSALLGFLGADFTFLIVMSLFTSRRGGTVRGRY